jgi:hypothetical protein
MLLLLDCCELVGRCGWLCVVVAGFGSLWVVVGSLWVVVGSLWVVVRRCGVVVGRSNYDVRIIYGNVRICIRIAPAS